MNGRIAAIGLAALLLVSGAVAAAPASGAATAAEPNDDHANDRAAGAGASDDHAQGPPVSMPEQVPDHVGEIHQQIRDFLAGDLDGSLGDAISGLTPGDDEAENDDAESTASDGQSGSGTTTATTETA
ncbi:hypothetical protein VB773_13465 [Haloarculaceae archaeon H-GB2-1]|nr:hypothetical protein [Haloarculaceae archaeon H-GB1-1]MEA5386973.1 hypothetical protein [Haloarculaceae archaeon H-GB11]MEA5408475.1 hypothetical protein [Haloarculaceae archaeon H-GB2-1]